MKKIILVMIIMVCILSGCDYGPEVEKYKETKTENTTPEGTEEKSPEEEKAPELFNDLEFEYFIEDDGFMDMVFTNNSEYAISEAMFTVKFKDNDKQTYFTNYNTVLPGEKSSRMNSFSPESKKIDDIEILKVNFTIKDKQGNERHIEYDNKLKIHEYTII